MRDGQGQLAVEQTGCVVCGGTASTPEAHGTDYLFRVTAQEFSIVRCLFCGHLYLNPRPCLSDISLLYPRSYPTFSGRFGEAAGLLARVKDAVLLRRFRAIPGVEGGRFRLLDIGCGDGRFLLSLRRQFPHAELTGLDWYFSPGVADALTGARIGMITGAAESAALPLDHYDIITMQQLIEHLWDVPAVLAACRAALRPAGTLAIETPNPEGWDRRFGRRGAWGGYYWPRHLNLFSTPHLIRLTREAGFVEPRAIDLVAPPAWISTLHYGAVRGGMAPARAAALFPDTSLFWLGVFTVVDTVAKRAGLRTSNQKLLCRRPAAG